jgi:hypothetical protein
MCIAQRYGATRKCQLVLGARLADGILLFVVALALPANKKGRAIATILDVTCRTKYFAENADML